MVQPLPNSILLLLISEFAGLPLTCLVLSRGVSRMLVLRKVNETKNDREKTGIIIIKNNIIYRCISTNQNTSQEYLSINIIPNISSYLSYIYYNVSTHVNCTKSPQTYYSLLQISEQYSFQYQVNFLSMIFFFLAATCILDLHVPKTNLVFRSPRSFFCY